MYSKHKENLRGILEWENGKEFGLATRTVHTTWLANAATVSA
jgi:hypothetical protein